MDVEELAFFEQDKTVEEVFDEFGKVRGSILLRQLVGDGFIQKNKDRFALSPAGKKKLNIKKEESNRRLMVFLSYSSLDYSRAKGLKAFLEEFGLDVFLAHTSIEPTTHWEDEIYNHLKKCDIFIPLLTKNFKDSKWTDQECGIAYSFNKKIIPLMIEDITPYGFLGKFQALRNDSAKWTWRNNDSRVEVINLIDKEFSDSMRTSILSSLESTRSWIIGKTKIKLLKKSEPFSKEEVNHILAQSLANNQIYDAEGARDYLSELLVRYTDQIDPKLKQSISDKIESDKAQEILGGKTEAGFPTLYGTTKEKLEQLKGYGGERIEELREELKKELEKEEREPSLVDGLKAGL